MAKGNFKVCVVHHRSLDYAYMLQPESGQHYIASRITREVLNAMMTDRAFEALKMLADKWSTEHHPTMDTTHASRRFQLLVCKAVENNSLWPTINTEAMISLAALKDILQQV
jgi:hypothetical protein